MSRVATAMTAVLLAVLVAGCMQSDDLDQASFRVAIDDAPNVVVANRPVDLHMVASGNHRATTAHADAHYWDNPPGSATLELGSAMTCITAATSTAMPGAFAATCQFPRSGDYYVQGHARVNRDADTSFDYWSPVQRIVAIDATSYIVTPDGIRNDVHPEDTPAFDLIVDGPAGVISDQLGAYYWTTPHNNPEGVIADATQCDNPDRPLSLPGSATLACTFPGEGTYYLRGRLSVSADDGTSFAYWTNEHQIDVRA